MIILLLLLTALYGFFAHLLHHPIQQRFSGGWCNLTEHTAGWILVSIPLAALEWIITKNKHRVIELMVKYYFIGGAFGVGNFLSWAFLG